MRIESRSNCAVAGALTSLLTAGSLLGAPPTGDVIEARVNEYLGLSASKVQPITVAGVVGEAGSAQLIVEGQPVTIEWQPNSLRGFGFKLLVTEDGEFVEKEPSVEKTFRGQVRGMEGSTVAGSYLDGGLFATIVMPDGQRYWVEPVAGRVEGDIAADTHVVYASSDVLPTGMSCANDMMIKEFNEPAPEALQGSGGPAFICTAELATDADFEYFQDYGSVQAVEDRINLIVNTVNVQYESEVDLTHVIVAMIIRTDSNDPYTQNGNNEFLCEVITEWTNNLQDIDRDVVHMFTGREISGSVIGQAADLGDICNKTGCCDCGQFGTDGSFCFSQSDFNNNFGCATDLTAHELGHLWDGSHCSCPSFTMNPSIACANTFNPAQTIPDLVAYRDSIACLDCQAALSFNYPNGLLDQVDPAGGDTITVEVTGNTSVPQPGSGVFHLSVDGGSFQQLAMSEVNPNVYVATFPATVCGSSLSYFFSAETAGGLDLSDPLNAPASAFNATSALGVAVSFDDDFEGDLGWTVQNSGLTDGAWDKGVPVGGGDRGDPPTDFDGSGQCFLTDNVDGNSDVDGGSTTLISPVMDASGGLSIISYARWFDNTAGDNPQTEPFTVEVSDDAGGSWVNLETVGPAGPEVAGGWFLKQFNIEDAGIEANNQFRIRFTAQDPGPAGSVVEAGIDAVQLLAIDCEPITPECPADVNGDGQIDSGDLNIVLGSFGMNTDVGDANGDGTVNSDDLNVVLGVFGEACPE